MRICLSVDFDALSGYLGTGHTPANTLADYSAGVLSAHVGVPRLLRLFRRHGLAGAVTWFIPGHSMETFPRETRAIVASGAEIGLHGYSHEGAYAMTVAQEREVLEKCIGLATGLLRERNEKRERDAGDGEEEEEGEGEGEDKKTRPVGYRAPLYQIRPSTVGLLQEYGFLYDSSMNAHDGLPYWLPYPFPQDPPHVPDYSQPAASWMVPTVLPDHHHHHHRHPPPPPPPTTTSTKPKGEEKDKDRDRDRDKALVEIPASWYTEDMTPLGFYPYTASTQGYVATEVVEKMWWDRFEWLWAEESFVDGNTNEEEDEDEDGLDLGLGWGTSSRGYGSIYPMIWHPESAGRAHIVGMIDRFLGKLVDKARASDGEITFECMADVASSWKEAAAGE